MTDCSALKADLAGILREVTRLEDKIAEMEKINETTILYGGEGQTVHKKYYNSSTWEAFLDSPYWFTTPEEAELEHKKLKVLRKLKKLSDRVKSTSDYDAYYIYKNVGGYCVALAWQITLGTVYFATRDDAEYAIEMLGDELEVLFK